MFISFATIIFVSVPGAVGTAGAIQNQYQDLVKSQINNQLNGYGITKKNLQPLIAAFKAGGDSEDTKEVSLISRYYNLFLFQ